MPAEDVVPATGQCMELHKTSINGAGMWDSLQISGKTGVVKTQRGLLQALGEPYGGDLDRICRETVGRRIPAVRGGRAEAQLHLLALLV